MPEILAILNVGPTKRINSEESAHSIPARSEEDVLRLRRQRNCISLTALLGSKPGSDGEMAGGYVAGVVIYELHKHHLAVIDLAVHPDHRRRGIGRQLVEKLVGKLSVGRRTNLRLTVWETNLGGLLFLRAMGFRATGLAKEAFEGDEAGLGPVDGVEMEYRIVEGHDGVGRDMGIVRLVDDRDGDGECGGR